MRYALLALLILANCTPADVVAPDAPLTTQTPEPEPEIETPDPFGIGSPVIMAWIDPNDQTAGTRNIFSHLAVNSFCTEGSDNEFSPWYYASIGKYGVWKPATLAQFNAQAPRIREFLSLQNMIEDVDYELNFNSSIHAGNGIQIFILNPALTRQGGCETTNAI